MIGAIRADGGIVDTEERRQGSGKTPDFFLDLSRRLSLTRLQHLGRPAAQIRARNHHATHEVRMISGE